MNLAYNICYTLAKWAAQAFFSFRVVHPERMVEQGPLILAVNHASYFDPPLAGICSRRAVYFLARRSLLDIPWLGRLLPLLNVIPVERDGHDRQALREVIRKLREGHGVVLFPEGTRSRDGQLGPARGGLGLVIAKTAAPVLPMRIFGSFEAFPREAVLPRPHPITVVLGEVMRFDPARLAACDKEDYVKLSQEVMAAIAALRQE